MEPVKVCGKDKASGTAQRQRKANGLHTISPVCTIRVEERHEVAEHRKQSPCCNADQEASAVSSFVEGQKARQAGACGRKECSES